MPNQTGGKVLRYALLGAVALAAVIWPAARMFASPKPARHENAKTRPQAASTRKSGSSTHAASKAGVKAASSTAHSAKTGTTSATHRTGKKTLASNRRGRTRREPKQMAPTPERIRDIQSALSMGGYYSAEPSGKWDGDTLGAMQRFQQAHGLTPSGKPDALTLQKLGLGSQIAGVSAPQPSALAVPSRLAKNPAPESEEPSEPLGTTQP